MNSENEKLREAFEEWFTATYTAHKLSPRQTNCGIITDGYADSRVDLCWRGWVASRAALSQQAEQPPVAWLWEYLGTHLTADKEQADWLQSNGVELQALYAAPIAQTERKPVAYRHTLHMELGQSRSVVSESENQPFGVRGENYDDSYSVTSEPLYTTPTAQTAPQPAQSELVEAASGALGAIQDALEDAYHNAYQECCGQAYLECCGSPVQAWSETDQKVMARFAPHEKALRAALAAQGGE